MSFEIASNIQEKFTGSLTMNAGALISIDNNSNSGFYPFKII